MTIQDLGSIGELIAATATVATLIYLAIQIRANTRAMAAESYRATQLAGAGALTALADNGELAEIFVKGMGDLGSLNAVELTRFTTIAHQLVSTAQLAHSESALGVDSPFFRAKQLRFLRSPGGCQWLQQNRQYWPPEFVEWMEGELELDSEGAA